MRSVRDRKRPGYFGEFGGRFAPETLMAPLEELERAWARWRKDPRFRAELALLLRDYAGRPTPITVADNLSRNAGGARIVLKREDLLHTGAHKLNNSLGQVLLAKRMRKKRVVAETGAGRHGVAAAAAAAKLSVPCRVYMGVVDMERQAPNVSRMRLLGAEVVGVDSGSRTLKDAINEAMRDWTENVATTHYVLGSALGPHPYPSLVRELQSVIGREARARFRRLAARDPQAAVACVGGGSNAIGLFSAFLRTRTKLFGVEAGGRGPGPVEHAARFSGGGAVGGLHGTRTWARPGCRPARGAIRRRRVDRSPARDADDAPPGRGRPGAGDPPRFGGHRLPRPRPGAVQIGRASGWGRG